MTDVLVTNDDGVESPGIRVLAEMVRKLGMTPIVAAPARNRSGASASLVGVGADGELAVEQRSWDGWDGTVLAAEATPALLAWLGVRQAFGGRPEIVASGINYGPNTGLAVLHSGTVGAALTAFNHGCSSIAVSLVLDELRRQEKPLTVHWETASSVAAPLLSALVASERPILLNVNVPNRPLGELAGVRAARLSSVGMVETTASGEGHGSLKVSFSPITTEPESESDAALVAAGFATVTALRSVSEDTAVDLSFLLDATRARSDS